MNACIYILNSAKCEDATLY